MFIKELNLYLDYLNDKIDEARKEMNDKQEKYLATFAKNLETGINYYYELFASVKDRFNDTRHQIEDELEQSKFRMQELVAQIGHLKMAPVTAG